MLMFLVFLFLNNNTNDRQQPQDLLDFLGLSHDNKERSQLRSPIYIEFGSIAGHDSRRMLGIVVDALERTGYRAVLCGLASNTDHLPMNIFKIDHVSHDWLFSHGSYGVIEH
jgi:UDP:flavonoid glycosyltransferase YjiC (YdhE family)